MKPTCTQELNQPIYWQRGLLLAVPVCSPYWELFFVIFSFLYDSRSGIKGKEVLCKLCCGYRITERDDGEVVTKYKLKSYHVILINLSVADIIVAASHLWGLSLNLENRFLPNMTAAHLKNQPAIPSGYDNSCVAQAIFSVISTLASFAWTDILVVFLAFNIVFVQCTNNYITGWKATVIPFHEGIFVPEQHKAPFCCEAPCFMYVIFPLIGWGIPIAMATIYGVQGKLGYSEDYDQGWCYFFLDPLKHKQRNHSMASETWLWLSIVLVLVCTIIYSCAVCCRQWRAGNYASNCTEFRYLSVGIAFAVLRLPSMVIKFHLMTNNEYYRTVMAAVMNIIASAALSLQGLVNGIIYLCCRSYVKERCCSRRRNRNELYEPINNN